MKRLLKGFLLLCAAAALTACGIFRGDGLAGVCIF